MTTSNIDTMSKIELRTACKAAGVTGYSKMDNAGMRAALLNAVPAAHAAPAGSVPVASDLPAETTASAPASESAAPVAPAAKSPTEKRNGVAMPKVGTVCRAIWNKADELGSPTIKELRTHAEAAGWDKVTTQVQFYRWRKFHGIAQQKKDTAAA